MKIYLYCPVCNKEMVPKGIIELEDDHFYIRYQCKACNQGVILELRPEKSQPKDNTT